MTVFTLGPGQNLCDNTHNVSPAQYTEEEEEHSEHNVNFQTPGSTYNTASVTLILRVLVLTYNTASVTLILRVLVQHMIQRA